MKNKIRKISLVLISVLLSLCFCLILGCDCQNNDDETVKSITFEKTNITVEVDSDVALKVTLVGIEQKDIVWESSDTAIATVDKGLVTGISSGTTEITAKCDDVSAKCTVVVVPNSNFPTLTLNKSSLNLFKNGEFQLNGFVTYNGSVVDAPITFLSSNAEVCSVSSTGKLLALKYGQVEIQVSTVYNFIELYETITVNVIPDLKIAVIHNGGEVLTNDFTLEFNEQLDFSLKAYLDGQEIDVNEYNIDYDNKYLNVAKVGGNYNVSSVRAGSSKIKINSTYEGYGFDAYIDVSVNKLIMPMTNSYIIDKNKDNVEIILPSEIELSNDLTVYFEKEMNGKISVSSFDDSTKTINLELSNISIVNDGLNTICVDDGISTIYKFENCVFPTKIFTQEDAETFSATIDQKLAGYYVLGSDIDFDGREIGRVGLYASYPFSGTFDGQGHALKNFVISKATSGVDNIKWANNALFAYTKNATIKNTYFEFKTANTFSVNNSTIGLIGCVYQGDLTMENVVSKMTLMGMPYATSGDMLVSSLVSWVEAGTLTLNNVVGIIETDVDVSATILEGKDYCGGNWGTVNGTNVLYANSVSDNFAPQLANFTASGYFTKDGDTLKFGDEIIMITEQGDQPEPPVLDDYDVEDYTALNTYLIEKERTSFKVDLTKVELTGNVTSVLFNDTSVDFTQEGNVITLANSVIGNPSVGSEVEISVVIGTTAYKLKCKAVSIVFTQADIDTDVTFFSETFRRNASNNSLAVTTGEYLLAEDLDFGGQEIGRIGQYASWVFSGAFDGQGYAIKNFKLSKATSGDDAKWANNALFAFVRNATIKNTYFEFKTANTFSVNNSTIGLVGAVYGGNLTMENVVSKMTLMGMPYATSGDMLVSSLVSWVEAGTLTLNNVVGIIETDVDVSATILEGKDYCGGNWGTVNGTNVLYANSVSDNFATQLANFTVSGYFTKDGDTLKFGDEVIELAEK